MTHDGSSFSRSLRVRPHVALSTRSRKPGVDLEEALSAVPDKVRLACSAFHQELARLHIRHAVCGGLAVGAHGHPRATKDVDFLVGDEAFVHHGPIVTSRAPFEIGGVAVDAVHFPDAPFLDEELPGEDTLAIVSLPALFYMKLRAGRMQDQADLVALLQAGADLGSVQAYLQRHAPEYLPPLARLVQIAQQEG